MNDDERDILLARYFDGSATAEQVEALERAIAGDPVIARMMLIAASDELALRDGLSTAGAASLTPGAADERVSAAADGDGNGNGNGNGDGHNGHARQPNGNRPPMRLADTPAAARAEDHSDSLSIHAHPAAGRWFRQPKLWLATAACLLIAAGITYWVARPSAPPANNVASKPAPASAAPLASITGRAAGVTIERGGVAVGSDAANGISRDDIIRTASIPATFAYAGEQTRITLGPASRLKLSGDAGGKQLELASGTVFCDVQKQQPGKSLLVVTPHAKVQVVGTRFEVQTYGAWTRVNVTQGTVRVTRAADGAMIDVSAGEFVYCGKPTAGNPTRPPVGFSMIQGRDLADYWSTKVKPAGLEH